MNVNVNNINPNKNKIVVKPKIVIKQTKRNHIEFLYRLHLYYDELYNEINGKKNLKTLPEEGYIINYKLIETFKNFYYYDEIKNQFEKGKTINEIIESLPNEYITKVQKQNEDILRKEELYYPDVKRYGNLEIKYFLNSTLLKSSLIKYLGNDFHLHNNFEASKVSYIIINQKIIIKYGMILNIGILDSNNIFISYILILCSGEESLNSAFNEIRKNNIDNIINQVNIIEKNIGKYKEHNMVVFINEKYIPQKQKCENKFETISYSEFKPEKIVKSFKKKNIMVTKPQNKIIEEGFNQNRNIKSNFPQNKSPQLNQIIQANLNQLSIKE